MGLLRPRLRALRELRTRVFLLRLELRVAFEGVGSFSLYTRTERIKCVSGLLRPYLGLQARVFFLVRLENGRWLGLELALRISLQGLDLVVLGLDLVVLGLDLVEELGWRYHYVSWFFYNANHQFTVE